MSHKGNISIGVGTLIGAITLAASVIGSYFTAQIGTNDRIIAASEKSASALEPVAKQAIETRTIVDLQEQRMDRFEAKLDKLLEHDNIDPQPINIRFQGISSTTTATKIKI